MGIEIIHVAISGKEMPIGGDNRNERTGHCRIEIRQKMKHITRNDWMLLGIGCGDRSDPDGREWKRDAQRWRCCATIMNLPNQPRISLFISRPITERNITMQDRGNKSEKGHWKIKT